MQGVAEDLSSALATSKEEREKLQLENDTKKKESEEVISSLKAQSEALDVQVEIPSSNLLLQIPRKTQHLPYKLPLVAQKSLLLQSYQAGPHQKKIKSRNIMSPVDIHQQPMSLARQRKHLCEIYMSLLILEGLQSSLAIDMLLLVERLKATIDLRETQR